MLAVWMWPAHVKIGPQAGGLGRASDPAQGQREKWDTHRLQNPLDPVTRSESCSIRDLRDARVFISDGSAPDCRRVCEGMPGGVVEKVKRDEGV